MYKKKNNKYRKLPDVSKDKLSQVEIGSHDTPNWLLYCYGIIIFIGVLVIIFY